MRRRLALAAGAAILLCSLAAPVTPAIALGRTLYVAPWGVDYAPDGWGTPPNSFESPWRTMFMAVRRALPGDRIIVRGGTYREAIGWGAVPGTELLPIRLEAFQGERVLLMGTIQLERADYWILRGINVTQDPARPRTQFLVKFDGGVGWQFLDAEVWGSRGVSNMMVIRSEAHGEPRDYVIAGNCIHDNEAVGDPFMNDHNLYLMPGYESGPGLIERNIFFNAENGANIKAAGNNRTTGAAYVTIRYNTMVAAGAAVAVGYGSHHVTMWRNLMGGQAGGSVSYNAAIIGNHVSGWRNVAVHTAVWGYPRSVRSTVDSPQPVQSASTVWAAPAFDDPTSCAGFYPRNPLAQGYGRFAGQSAPLLVPGLRRIGPIIWRS